MSINLVYRVTFLEKDKVNQFFCKYISEESLEGFIDFESLLFNSILDTPSNAEAISETEFKGVQRVYLPVRVILRIDEIHLDSSEQLKLLDASKNNVSPLRQ